MALCKSFSLEHKNATPVWAQQVALAAFVDRVCMEAKMNVSEVLNCLVGDKVQYTKDTRNSNEGRMCELQSLFLKDLFCFMVYLAVD